MSQTLPVSSFPGFSPAGSIAWRITEGFAQNAKQRGFYGEELSPVVQIFVSSVPAAESVRRIPTGFQAGAQRWFEIEQKIGKPAAS